MIQPTFCSSHRSSHYSYKLTRPSAVRWLCSSQLLGEEQLGDNPRERLRMLLHRLHTAVAIGDVDCGEGGGTVERKRASELGLFLATNPIEKRTKREGVRDEGENWGKSKHTATTVP